MKLPDNTQVKSIDLRVRNLSDTLNFYSEMLGFKLIKSDEKSAYLSADGKDPYVIGLHEESTAASRKRGTPGLYHTAFLFPGRKELGKVFMRLFNAGMKFQGFSDHLVSEAVYLSDPDGNGVELYADKPQSEWTWEMGQVMMDSLPLDLSLITKDYDENEKWSGVHPDTRIGHIHLNVSDLLAAEKFYSGLLGMNVTNSTYPGAKFFAAGKYHHHIGTNIWSAGRNAVKDENSLGLISYRLSVPEANAIAEIKRSAEDYGIASENLNGDEISVRDFDGNKILISHSS